MRRALLLGVLALLACASPPPAAFCPEGTIAQGSGPPLDLERRCELRSDDAEPLLHGPFESWYQGEGGAEPLRQEQGSYAGGEPVGCWSRWHRNGSLDSTGCYSAGKPHGHWVFFDESGRLHSEGRYHFGREHGVFRYWHSNGALQAVGEFREGRKRGEWIFMDTEGRPQELRHFDEQGKLFERVEFRDGRVVDDAALLQSVRCPQGTELVASELDPERGFDAWCRRSDPEGRPVPHGPYREILIGGAIYRQGFYDQGRKQEIWRTYYPEGGVSEEGRYERGLAVGSWSTFHPDGSPKSRDSYRRGAVEGPHVAWHPGGVLAVEGNTREGQRDGIWTFFTPIGALDHLASFRSGELVDVTDFEAGQPYRCADGSTRSSEKQDGGLTVGCSSPGRDGSRVWQGRSSTFRADGARVSIETYRDGTPDGPYRRFHPDGSPAVEGAYLLGRESGIWLERDERGRVRSRTAYEAGGEHRVELHENGALRALAHKAGGAEDGVELRWYASGRAQQKGRWSHGKRVGCWYQWDQSGFLARLVRFTEEGTELQLDSDAVCADLDGAAPLAAPEPSR